MKSTPGARPGNRQTLISEEALQTPFYFYRPRAASDDNAMARSRNEEKLRRGTWVPLCSLTVATSGRNHCGNGR